jgi:hypothetical protein
MKEIRITLEPQARSMTLRVGGTNHHRLAFLSTHEARRLAADLLRCADFLDGAAVEPQFSAQQGAKGVA